MNIREFAKLCGVSASAVSRIMNHSQKDSQAAQETYERIRRLAQELGYKPNYAARTLHTQKSNCLGVIINFLAPNSALSLLSGISEVAYRNELSLSVVNCANDMERETQAFDTLLYRGVDAIVWHPTYQEGAYTTRHVEAALARSPRRVPVACLSTNDMSGIFKPQPLNWEEGPCIAAERQLRAGCTRFAILLNRLSVPLIAAAGEAYRQALLQRGVAPEQIVDFVFDAEGADWSRCAGVKGLWMYHMFRLPGMLPQLRQVCDLKSLHVDGQSFVDDYLLVSGMCNNLDGGLAPRFASLRYSLLDLCEVARAGTEIVIRAIADPSIVPCGLPMMWKSPDSCGLR